MDIDKELQTKIDNLFKQLSKNQQKKVWKKTLRESSAVIRSEMKSEYKKELHKGMYKTPLSGRTVQNVRSRDVSSKKYPLRNFDIQFLIGVIDEGEDSTYKGFGRSFTSFWYERGTADHSNRYKKDGRLIKGIEAHDLQSEILKNHENGFINNYYQTFLKNLEKAVHDSKK